MDRHEPVRPPPGRGLSQGSVEHPLAERVDQPRGLGDPDRVGRGDHAALGVAPAQQCLHGRDPAGAQVADRLVGQGELGVGVGEGLGEVAGEAQGAHRRVLGGRRVVPAHPAGGAAVGVEDGLPHVLQGLLRRVAVEAAQADRDHRPDARVGGGDEPLADLLQGLAHRAALGAVAHDRRQGPAERGDREQVDLVAQREHPLRQDRGDGAEHLGAEHVGDLGRVAHRQGDQHRGAAAAGGLLLRAAYLTQQGAAVARQGDGAVVGSRQRDHRSRLGRGEGHGGRLRGRGSVRAARLHLVPPCIDVWHDGPRTTAEGHSDGPRNLRLRSSRPVRQVFQA
ncbi:hypothetical protein NOMA109596_16310 [Nocardioides marinus]